MRFFKAGVFAACLVVGSASLCFAQASPIVKQIAVDADDGRNDGTNWISATTGDIIGFGSVQRNSGFRFTGITIGAGATITGAKLTVKETNFDTGGSFTTTISAWKTNNPAAFDSTNRPNTVPLTTANASWTFNSTTNLNTIFDSADFTSVISELYSTYGFSNSSVAIVVTGSGSGNDAYLEDLFAAGGNAAKLTITYTGGSSTPGCANGVLLLGAGCDDDTRLLSRVVWWPVVFLRTLGLRYGVV